MHGRPEALPHAADPLAPSVRQRLYFNGKFYGGAMNGVHRVADRLLREIDALALRGGASARWDMRLLLPTGETWAPGFGAIAKRPQRLGHTQFWEQMLLPNVARDGALASFANLSPARHRRKLTMVHDAQFRLSPESYPPKLRFGYRLLIPRGARRSRIVLTVSDYARDSLATFGIADADRTIVLHNGADHIVEAIADFRLHAAHGLGPGGYCLLFGSTARYKNLAVALAAFADPALADRTLVVIGPDRAVLAAAGLSAPANAIFVGTVDDASLRALYEGAHALLYPSRTEGFGLPPVESMLCGCPVIAAPAGAVPEICRDAICYAGMDSSAEWVAAIRSLDDPLRRRAKVAAGRVRAAGFTWRRAGERLAHILTPLVEGGARA